MMEEGNPRSIDEPNLQELTQEEIWRLLDAATDYKIKQEADAEMPCNPDASASEDSPGADDERISGTVRILSDLLTIQEHFGYLKEIAFRYLGDEPDTTGKAWKLVCDKMGMEYLADGDAPEFPEDVSESDVTAIAMETDADEQQLYLYALPPSHDTVQAVTYAMTHTGSKEDISDET